MARRNENDEVLEDNITSSTETRQSDEDQKMVDKDRKATHESDILNDDEYKDETWL